MINFLLMDHDNGRHKSVKTKETPEESIYFCFFFYIKNINIYFSSLTIIQTPINFLNVACNE